MIKYKSEDEFRLEIIKFDIYNLEQDIKEGVFDREGFSEAYDLLEELKIKYNSLLKKINNESKYSQEINREIS